MVDGDPKVPIGEQIVGNQPRSEERTQAKRIVISHNFSNYSHGEWSDSKKRRNVKMRAGYRHPEDAALAMIDVYYAVNDKTTKPECIAASAIYAASIVFSCREKQSRIGQECNVSASTIRKYYVDLLEYIEA